MPYWLIDGDAIPSNAAKPNYYFRGYLEDYLEGCLEKRLGEGRERGGEGEGGEEICFPSRSLRGYKMRSFCLYELISPCHCHPNDASRRPPDAPGRPQTPFIRRLTLPIAHPAVSCVRIAHFHRLIHPRDYRRNNKTNRGDICKFGKR